MTTPDPRNQKPPHVREEFPLSDITGRIIAAAQEVHRNLGPGYEEVFYQRALALELSGKGLEFNREVWIEVFYKGMKLGKKRVDFIIEGVMVEIKAKKAMDEVDFMQTLSYLKASRFEIGLLLNYGSRSLEIRRLINS